MWRVSSDSLLTAIKKLKLNSSSDDRVKMLQEAAIMGQFCHTNVVKLYGLVTIGTPVSRCNFLKVYNSFVAVSSVNSLPGVHEEWRLEKLSIPY